MNELDTARYISLTTFKKDGSPASTPVWITGTGGSYLFTTGDKAWKTRRLRNNPSVEVRVCDMRGRVKPGAAVHAGTGEIRASVDAAEQALRTKYGWQFTATKIVDGLKNRLSRGGKQEVVAIHLSVDDGLDHQ